MTEMCVFLGLRSGVAEGSFFVDCDAASLDNRNPTFRENAEFSFSMGRNVQEEYLTIRRHEDDTVLSRDVGIRFPSGAASYRRILESPENVFLSA